MDRKEPIERWSMDEVPFWENDWSISKLLKANPILDVEDKERISMIEFTLCLHDFSKTSSDIFFNLNLFWPIIIPNVQYLNIHPI